MPFTGLPSQSFVVPPGLSGMQLTLQGFVASPSFLGPSTNGLEIDFL